MRTHFPRDIILQSPPLGEAWLEIQWKLEETGDPGRAVDREFPFALGMFYAAVKDCYPLRKDLDTGRAPADLFPHVIRHQFWSGPSRWPVLQIGPGVASLNFTKPYSWGIFREQALFLREKIYHAYAVNPPDCMLIALRYQNREPFEFGSNDVLSFLAQKLNIRIEMPPHVPGEFSQRPFPAGFTMQSSYDLQEPRGKAVVLVSTAVDPAVNSSENPLAQQRVAWQLDVLSEATDASVISDVPAFEHWLDAAHAAVHEWFLAHVDGDLLHRYSEGTL